MISRHCPICRRDYTPDLALKPDFLERFIRWKRREGYVQDIWPDATWIEREQLLSGTCGEECWDKIFPAKTPKEIADAP